MVVIRRSVANSVSVSGESVKGTRVPLSPGGDRLLQVIATAGQSLATSSTDVLSQLLGGAPAQGLAPGGTQALTGGPGQDLSGLGAQGLAGAVGEGLGAAALAFSGLATLPSTLQGTVPGALRGRCRPGRRPRAA